VARAEEGTVWRREQFAVDGTCEYCGDVTLVKDEPFGGRPACRPCWFQIIDGEDE
jgi:hypothetical protein